jgi:hypothetical protein
MKDDNKKIIFGLSFPAIMVVAVLAIVLSSTKK